MLLKGFVSVCIFLFLKNSGRYQVNGFYSESYSNLIGNYDILERHVGCKLTELTCAKLCYYHSKCVSFFYFDQQCQLHYDVLPSSQNLLPYLGSKYFIILQSAIQHPDGVWDYFNGSCYFFSNDTTTWYNAKNICASMNANLAIVSSEEENEFMKMIAKDILGAHSDGFWLDGTDEFTEGDWIWNRSGERLNSTYQDWGRGEPNNYHGVENCLEMYPKKRFKWNDSRCKRSDVQFICEMFP